ncbi:hypothetical protein G9C85_08680 [Halorubellus sp. JP-L1]|uniref:head-tail joining protein n=1 Tax=Halorubellus sp. JP-L1 TaxID=2715753 RepID=UPI00140E3285|nr:hypothetical protein [Halorubellus sp. JP-L1]NHN41706.1 hypothetical protein [Halorubellus sp. JP-L1]
MQRRAAAAYIAFFLVIAAGSYAFIATADAPDVTISGDDVREIEEGDTVTVDGRTYTVASVSATAEEGGGHGGGGGVSYEIVFEWTNESAEYSETWAANSTVEYENQTRRVLPENGTDRVLLRWEPTEQYRPAWDGGVQYIDSAPDEGGRQDVAVTAFVSNSSNESIQNVTLRESETIDRSGNQTTVANVSNSSVRLEWIAPTTNEVAAANHQNVSLNGQPYVVHFEDNDTVRLGQGENQQQALQDTIRKESRFHDRINGVWGITIGSTTTIVLLLGLAFLPRKE